MQGFSPLWIQLLCALLFCCFGKRAFLKVVYISFSSAQFIISLHKDCTHLLIWGLYSCHRSNRALWPLSSPSRKQISKLSCSWLQPSQPRRMRGPQSFWVIPNRMGRDQSERMTRKSASILPGSKWSGTSSCRKPRGDDFKMQGDTETHF